MGADRKGEAAPIAVLAAVLMIAFCVLPHQMSAHAESQNEDWPMYRYDAAHTGYSTSNTPTVSPVQLWNYTLESTPSSVLAPVIAGGFVYVGSADHNLQQFTAYCLKAATGAKVWSAPIGDVFDSLAVADGRVFVGSADGNVYAIDASNGMQIWNYSIRDAPNDSADVPLTLADNHVFVVSWSGNVYCLNAADGSRIWNYTTGSDSHGGCPAVTGGYVYVGTGDGDVYCLDASNGAKTWNFTAGGPAHSPTVADGYLYFGSSDGNAYCLNAANGDKIWNYTTEFNSNGPSHGYYWGNSVSDPAVAYGRVYVGSSDFLVYCLDAASGNQIWNYTTSAEVYAAPAVAGGCVMAGSYDGNLYCLNATDGSQIWSFSAGVFSSVNAAGSAGSPAIAADTVYVAGNGVLYALGKNQPSSNSASLPLLIAVVTSIIAVVAVAACIVYKRKNAK